MRFDSITIYEYSTHSDVKLCSIIEKVTIKSKHASWKTDYGVRARTRERTKLCSWDNMSTYGVTKSD